MMKILILMTLILMTSMMTIEHFASFGYHLCFVQDRNAIYTEYIDRKVK